HTKYLENAFEGEYTAKSISLAFYSGLFAYGGCFPKLVYSIEKIFGSLIAIYESLSPSSRLHDLQIMCNIGDHSWV
ncbi:hypothetical protein CEXT_454411, partial [Caerostris extrusa]